MKRRQTLAALIPLVLMAATVAPAGARTTIHGNVARTGAYVAPGPKQLGGVKWSFAAGGPIVTSPAISGDTLYFVSSTGALAALDIATGRPKRVFATEFERKFEAKDLQSHPPAARAPRSTAKASTSPWTSISSCKGPLHAGSWTGRWALPVFAGQGTTMRIPGRSWWWSFPQDRSA